MEQILKNELIRQVTFRVRDKINAMMSVQAYLSGIEIKQLINNILNCMPKEIETQTMLPVIYLKLHAHYEDYDFIVLNNGKEFIVNKDRVSKEIFEEMEGNK